VDGDMRLDDLAAAAGVPTTTVRLYQNKRLLPPPRLVGRTGYYGPAHLNRLRLIGRLQDDGFSLTAIARLLEAWERGRRLDDLLATEAAVEDTLTASPSVTLTTIELSERLGLATIEPETLRRAVQLGLIELVDDGRIRVVDERFLMAGAAMLRLGLPPAVALEEWSRLLQHTDDVAARFVAVFETHVVPDGALEAALSDGRAFASSIQELRSLARLVTETAVDTSLQRIVSQRLAELVGEPASRPRPGVTARQSGRQ
jgi:DNA-binding transcriptional MerR regulator